MNTKGMKILAVLAVLAMAFTAFAVIDNGAAEDAADITYIHGDIIKDQSYTAGKIIVDQDLNVKNGAILSISGTAEFIVPAGVVLTIDGDNGLAGDANKVAKLLVNQTNGDKAFITVDGSIVVGEKGVFLFKATKALDVDGNEINSIVNGSIDVNRGGIAKFDSQSQAFIDNGTNKTAEIVSSGYIADKNNWDKDKYGSTYTGNFDDRTIFIVYKLTGSEYQRKDITCNVYGPDGEKIFSNPLDELYAGEGTNVLAAANNTGDGAHTFLFSDLPNAEGERQVKAGQFNNFGIYTIELKTSTEVILTDKVYVGGSDVADMAALIFADGSSLNVSSTGSYISTVSGAVYMESGSNASIFANIGTIPEQGAYTAGGLVLYASDIQMIADSNVDVVKAQFAIQGTAKQTTSNNLSKFSISVDSNVYNAWTDMDPAADTEKMQKVKIVEEILNINMNIRNGEFVGVNGDYSDIAYTDKKTDGDDVYPASSVVFQGENKVSKGSLIVWYGDVYIADAATLSFKNDIAAKIAIAPGASVYVSGSVDLYTANTGGCFVGYNLTTALCGDLIIDGGIVTFTDKNATPTTGFPYEVCPANGIVGAWFLNDDKDVMTICEIEAAFAAAVVDKDIEVINVCGFKYNSVTSTEDDAYIIKTDFTVREGLILGFGGYVIVDEGVTLAIETGGAVGLANYPNASSRVEIDGAILDYNCSIKSFDKDQRITFDYSVILTEDDEVYEIYISFANAMDIAEAGDEIEIVKPAVIDTSVTIPEGVKVTMKKFTAPSFNYISIIEDGKLTNKGILDITGSMLMVENPMLGVDGYFVNENIVVFKKNDVSGQSLVVCPTGFHGVGEIFDEGEEADYLLSVDVVEQYSNMLTKLDVCGDVAAKILTLVSGEDGLDINITGSASLTVKELVLDNGCKLIVGITAKWGFTGDVTFEDTSAGKSTLSLYEQDLFTMFVDDVDEDDDVTDYVAVFATMVVPTAATPSSTVMTTLNDFAVVSGLVEIRDDSGDDLVITGALYVAPDATLVIGDGVELEICAPPTTNGTINPTMPTEYDVIIDGTLCFADCNNPSKLDGDVSGTINTILLNGELVILNTNGVTINDCFVSVFGSIAVYEGEDEKAFLELRDSAMYVGIDIIEYHSDAKWSPSSQNGLLSISGEVRLGDESDTSFVFNYGYDLQSASILTEDGKKTAYSTEFFVNEMPFATAYSGDDGTPILGSIIPAYVQGYAFDYTDGWYTDVEFTDPASSKHIGEVDVVYGEVKSLKAAMKFSAGVGITLYVDDMLVDGDASYEIGTYNIKAIVKPGYQSDVKIMFDGKEIKDTFTITPELAEKFDTRSAADDDMYIMVTAMGDVTPTPEPEKGMSVSEILLIVLVILIAIMAVVVALRLNRS